MNRKSKIKQIIAKKCEEVVPLATKVYYRPIFNRLKPADFKVPMEKKKIIIAKKAVERGDGKAALEALTELRESLERFYERLH